MTDSMRIADRLEAARRSRFVGRELELALFRAALLGEHAPFAVLHIHGPGGVGKSTLLREYRRLATQAGRLPVLLDARDVDPSPGGLLLALSQALRLDCVDPAAVAARWPSGAVLLIDTYERLAPLDAWLRMHWLPLLPARTLVVFAGRNEPDPGWRTDPEWSALTRVVALGNFSAQESLAYLALRQIPPEQRLRALEFTHGHPLALSLFADAAARGDPRQVHPGNEPEVVRVLLDRFVGEVPSHRHWCALYVCVTVWATTEALLAACLRDTDAGVLFEWLGQLSFIEHGVHGLFPHDLAREVIYAELRRRNPDLCETLKQRVLDYLHSRLERARGLQQQRAWFDMLHVQRHNPAIRPYFDWASFGDAYAEPASPADHAEIVAMVERHEGLQSAAIARHWLARQPKAFLAIRRMHGDLLGFCALVRLDMASPEDVATDPAAAQALEFVRRTAPLRAGEEILHGRYWMSRDGYQEVSQVFNLTAVASMICWIRRPKLAWWFHAMAHPGRFEPMFEKIRIRRAPAADFEVGARRYAVFAHDWRSEPAALWLRSGAERVSEKPACAPYAVLTEEAFTAAVRAALRDYSRPASLCHNPLLHTRLVAGHEGTEQPVERLRTLLQEAAQTLATNPKDHKLYLALLQTYLEPAATQEQAAELLDLPFNTYRYRLARATDRVAAWLWQQELAAVPHG
ncbi:MAG TPA: ATP-binding protein [Burkholderiales bacterium]|nr:ATP-binding protein [Burkholderiales bacterium]